MKNNTKTVEGIHACKIIHNAAIKMGIEMPITKAVYEVIYENKKPSEVIVELMSRSLKSE